MGEMEIHSYTHKRECTYLESAHVPHLQIAIRATREQVHCNAHQTSLLGVFEHAEKSCNGPFPPERSLRLPRDRI